MVLAVMVWHHLFLALLLLMLAAVVLVQTAKRVEPQLLAVQAAVALQVLLEPQIRAGAVVVVAYLFLVVLVVLVL
jgi:hypothetical protein